jgi:hypothetical protein
LHDPWRSTGVVQNKNRLAILEGHHRLSVDLGKRCRGAAVTLELFFQRSATIVRASIASQATTRLPFRAIGLPLGTIALSALLLNNRGSMTPIGQCLAAWDAPQYPTPPLSRTRPRWQSKAARHKAANRDCKYYKWSGEAKKCVLRK